MQLRLRELREAKGLTQKELASQIHKAYATVQSWERGDSFPNAEMLWRLCEFFSTDPNEFMGWWDEHPRPGGEQAAADPYEAELISCYRASTVEAKSNILGNARGQRELSLKTAESAETGPEMREACA